MEEKKFVERIIKVYTIKELLECKKYQKICHPNSPEGSFEVYMGSELEKSCNCDCGCLIKRPITLTKQIDETITVNKIMTLHTSFIKEFRPVDIHYETLLSDYNKGVPA